MRISFSTPARRSPAQPGFASLAVAAIAALLLVLPGAAVAARPIATTASAAKIKGRFDRLSVRGVHGGVLVRGSVLPGSRHVRASVTLLLRTGSQGAFKRAQTVNLAANDRNFALLHPLPSGQWDVEVRFQDPGHVVATTSRPQQVPGLAPAALHSVLPGSIRVSNGSVTYSAMIQSPLQPTTVQLLGLDVGPAVGTTKGIPRTPANFFKVLATTPVGAGTGPVTFTLHATLKRGQRWTLLLERSSSAAAGIDYEGLRTVRVS